MEKLLIKGGRRLQGEIQVSGAKNSAVALIPATILAESTTVIENLPRIRDVEVYEEILRSLGARVERNRGDLSVDATDLTNIPLPNGKVKRLRASYYLMGALLGRFGEAVIGLPGGCNLGPRPIDQHIKGFEALGARVEHRDGAIHLLAPVLTGARIYLDVVSVGATINIMLAASKAKGTTVIENAAKEPEIIDVATLLNSMGARIKGAGTDVIRVRGFREMTGCRHSIIPDRIEAGTYMVAAAATAGEVLVKNVIPKHMEPVTAKLREMGVHVEEADETLLVTGADSYQPLHIKTLPYPGFPTDLQQPFTSLLTRAKGTSMVTDNIYSSRFKHVDELCRLGAQIRVEGRTAVIKGRTPLVGSEVQASDLRAGAALVVAGLMAEDITEIAGLEHIDRGYENLEEKLRHLGAEVWREE
ncbi:UDP-N-acetylglucosamine 1-carboxyvinyltransferase [Desmospora profundinema]|uniref:UDP-N-acetylglucosamine 1-carboxyvinyltransferase n=1 Tax=Desmospora profundinema TaxID=1571184 RepID=A0ABU1ILB5_9BACL|nr:UDP-N-acetylglucosamine 1-carboxyvinyltransferase [Desmospora profundinema]MDR6225486.1 UDP-N-acetylglucosamine 1-carboxyvinyltransferase [Desmospora profundinema]